MGGLNILTSGSQPAKLATAVYNCATHIDDLPSLESMAEKIAHHYVQTHIQPEQYPIVGVGNRKSLVF